MKSHLYKICFALVIALLIFNNACLVSTESATDKTVAVTNLEPEISSVYPQGASDITAMVSAPEEDTVQYVWSTDGGNITGEGATVRWQSPNEYGDFHVMVTVSDGTGASDQATVTMHVVPRPVRHCCGR